MDIQVEVSKLDSSTLKRSKTDDSVLKRALNRIGKDPNGQVICSFQRIWLISICSTATGFVSNNLCSPNPSLWPSGIGSPAWDGTGCEFDSWQIYIPCSLSLRLLGSLRGSLSTYGLTQKLCLKKIVFNVFSLFNAYD